MKTRFFPILAVMALGGTASAATIELNFADGQGNREVSNQLVYSDEGVDVAVSALADDDLPRAVHINGETGLGVAGNTEFFEGNRIGRGESLTFAFSSPVAFDQLVTFDEASELSPIVFAVLVDGEQAGFFTLRNDDDNFQVVDLSGLGVGTELSIVGLTGPEGFRVTALRAAVVPVPGAFVLLGAALVSLGAARRRQRVVA